MNEWMAGHLPFLNRASWYAHVRRTNKMYTFLINDLINYIIFGMFRATNFPSSGRLYKQLYGILSCVYISGLVADRKCLIFHLYRQSSLWHDVFYTHTSCHRQDFLYRCMITFSVHHLIKSSCPGYNVYLRQPFKSLGVFDYKSS